MHPIIQKTFGGLSAQYYARQFIFGLIVSAFFYYMSTHGGKNEIQYGTLVFILINTLLYPYARFVYETVIDFFLGQNVFLVNAILMLIVKFITMTMCWAFSIFIAPVGLAYLYYHHSKTKVE